MVLCAFRNMLQSYDIPEDLCSIAPLLIVYGFAHLMAFMHPRDMEQCHIHNGNCGVQLFLYTRPTKTRGSQTGMTGEKNSRAILPWHIMDRLHDDFPLCVPVYLAELYR